jgi:sugar lactone lactonase YvrE
MRRLVRAAGYLLFGLVVLLVAVRLLFGGGRRLEDRTTAPALPGSALEVVAELDHPPGNIAVSATGRVFFTFHPDGGPPVPVAELVDGRPVPWERPGAPAFETPLSLRIDRQGRLWILDHARFGRGQPRIVAFDLATNALVHRYDFPPEVAGFLSMLNDFNVDPEGERIYIAESSPILQRPAIIVYDVAKQESRRVLDRHPSVQAEDYVIQTAARDMVLFGIYTLRIGVDSIALDRRGEWLYYGPVSGPRMYRVPVVALGDASLTPQAVADRVEDFGPKPLSDGLSTDDAGNVYITDPEHSAILTLGSDRGLRTLVKDTRLRWPDGLSFGPDGWLYVTCSALQDVLFRSAAAVPGHAPYQIFRLQPGMQGVPGQ